MSDATPPPPSEEPPPSTGSYSAPPPPTGGYGAPTPGQQPPGFAPGVPRPGDLGDRFVARLIDGVLLAIVGFVLNLIFAAILVSNTTVNFETGEVHQPSRFLYGLVTGLVLAALYLGYQSLMESNGGQSVGKMVMKLKVVGPDGTTPPTLAEAVRRNIWLAFPIGLVIPVVGFFITGVAALVAEIMIAVGINNDTVKRQAWHDHFAGETEVLKIG